MPELEWNNILIAAAAVITVSSLIKAIWGAIESWRKITHADEKAAAEATQNAEIEELKGRVAKCEERLRKGDQQFADTRSDMTQTLTVLNALLMHFISGNDHEKLRDVKKDLDNYLTGR